MEREYLSFIMVMIMLFTLKAISISNGIYIIKKYKCKHVYVNSII